MPSLPEVSKNLILLLIGTGFMAVVSWVLSLLDLDVPIWLLPLAAIVGGAVGYIVGQIREFAQNLPAYHSDHVAEVILTLQEILAGKLHNISFDDFIERGILGPARFGLSSDVTEEIRASVLVPDGARQNFKMEFESGHGVGRKQNFTLPIAGSFMGHAFASGELVWTNDVERDNRWSRHPQARPGREYGSLAGTPIVVGDRTVGVLSVLSTCKHAFVKGDLTYIELLGAVIGLAWALHSTPPVEAHTIPQPAKGSSPKPRRES